MTAQGSTQPLADFVGCLQSSEYQSFSTLRHSGNFRFTRLSEAHDELS